MKKEWIQIAEVNGITTIWNKLSEELGELKAVVDECRAEDFPMEKHFDALVSEIADVKACVQQLVYWYALKKPVKAMKHYKAVRQAWRWDENHEN